MTALILAACAKPAPSGLRSAARTAASARRWPQKRSSTGPHLRRDLATSAPGLGHICAGTGPHLRRDWPTSAPGLDAVPCGAARSYFNRPAAIAALLRSGADVAALEAEGRTALQVAVQESHVMAAEALLSSRQNLKAQKFGAAFDEAKKQRSFDLITTLGKYEPHVQSMDGDGEL